MTNKKASSTIIISLLPVNFVLGIRIPPLTTDLVVVWIVIGRLVVSSAVVLGGKVVLGLLVALVVGAK